jgi:hypothetical protein
MSAEMLNSALKVTVTITVTNTASSFSVPVFFGVNANSNIVFDKQNDTVASTLTGDILPGDKPTVDPVCRGEPKLPVCVPAKMHTLLCEAALRELDAIPCETVRREQ